MWDRKLRDPEIDKNAPDRLGCPIYWVRNASCRQAVGWLFDGIVYTELADWSILCVDRKVWLRLGILQRPISPWRGKWDSCGCACFDSRAGRVGFLPPFLLWAHARFYSRRCTSIDINFYIVRLVSLILIKQSGGAAIKWYKKAPFCEHTMMYTKYQRSE